MYIKVIQLYIYIYQLFIKFLSYVGNYTILSRVPCAIQWVLVVYLFFCVVVCTCQPQAPNFYSTSRYQ